LKIAQLLERYIDDDKLALLHQDLQQGQRVLYYLKGIAGSQLSLLAGALYKLGEQPHLLVLNDKEEAAYIYNDLQKILPDDGVLFYPGSYRRPYDVEETDNANILLRAEALSHINSRKRSPVIVTYPDALFERVVTRKELKGNTLQIKTGDKLDIDFLNETLFEYQFNRVDYVIEPGQFSVRGGIVDVFSFAHDEPYRIEFFDDEVESIRTFDIESQLTTKRVTRMQLVPNLENKAMLESRQSFMQYISGNTVVWLRSLSTAKEKLINCLKRPKKLMPKLSSDIKHAKPDELFLHAADLEKELTQFSIMQFGSERAFGVTDELILKVCPNVASIRTLSYWLKRCKRIPSRNYQTCLLCSSQQQIERFYSIFEDIGHDVHFQPILGALHEGFDDPLHKLACYTDHQIFERYQRFKLKKALRKSRPLR
jgi:transcription-repair coupling factor (superfamily II helicase)